MFKSSIPAGRVKTRKSESAEQTLSTDILPLYVVDGLFTDNINYLNPADIESMEILKDPSSLAIFGVRGANGVIIITTKRAKEGQTTVSINASVGFKHIGDRVELYQCRPIQGIIQRTT